VTTSRYQGFVTGGTAHLVLLAWRGDRATTPAPAPSTPSLIDGCRRGDRAALDEVLREHAVYLERLLARLVGPRADLEDLLQDTFAAAIAAFPRFRGEASVKTWLHRIAINTAGMYLRRPRMRRETPLVGDPPAKDATPAQDVERRELATKLYAHLDALDATKRIAFVLHVLDERPIAEVAAMMGASKAATKSRIFWARRMMVKRLDRDPAFVRGAP
jgi:RNA polymerase sigma-70 factor (ECF subfamily)